MERSSSVSFSKCARINPPNISSTLMSVNHSELGIEKFEILEFSKNLFVLPFRYEVAGSARRVTDIFIKCFSHFEDD